MKRFFDIICNNLTPIIVTLVLVLIILGMFFGLIALNENKQKRIKQIYYVTCKDVEIYVPSTGNMVSVNQLPVTNYCEDIRVNNIYFKYNDIDYSIITAKCTVYKKG